MIVWKIESDNANPLGEASIGFFETKSYAENHAKANGIRGAKPERVKVENRTQLANELNLAAGLGFTGYDSANEANGYAAVEEESE
jgi:hypothetical protein|tara:strand:- start:8784 stop:9041 length:258 start_codon:yes stop_codon:yes gene_type:complete